jgi:hypothetical protein
VQDHRPAANAAAADTARACEAAALAIARRETAAARRRAAALALLAASGLAAAVIPWSWWISTAHHPAMSCARAAAAADEVARGERPPRTVTVHVDDWRHLGGTGHCDGHPLRLASSTYDAATGITLPRASMVRLGLRADGRVDALEYCLGCSFGAPSRRHAATTALAALLAAAMTLAFLVASAAAVRLPRKDTPWARTTQPAQDRPGAGPFRTATSVPHYRRLAPGRHRVGESIRASRHPAWAAGLAPLAAAFALIASNATGPAFTPAYWALVAAGPALLLVALAARAWATAIRPGELHIQAPHQATLTMANQPPLAIRAITRHPTRSGGHVVFAIDAAGTPHLVESRSPLSPRASSAEHQRERALTEELDTIAQQLGPRR